MHVQEDWESIPDIGDYTIKNKKRFQSFAPVPDTLLAGAVGNMETSTDGLQTPAAGTTTDLTAVGEGRGTMVKLKLDRMSDSVSGTDHAMTEDQQEAVLHDVAQRCCPACEGSDGPLSEA